MEAKSFAFFSSLCCTSSHLLHPQVSLDRQVPDQKKPNQGPETKETTSEKKQNNFETDRHNETEKTRISLSKSGGVHWHPPQAPGSKDKDPIPMGIKLHPLHTAANLIFTA